MNSWSLPATSLFLFPAIQKDVSTQQFHFPDHCWLRTVLLPTQKSILDAYTFWYLIKQMHLTQYTFFCPKKSKEILNSHRQPAQQNFHVTEYMISHKLKGFFYLCRFFLEALSGRWRVRYPKTGRKTICNNNKKKSATSNKRNYPRREEM